MDTKYRNGALLIACIAALSNRVWMSEMRSSGQTGQSENSCDPVATDGKEVPQQIKYYEDDKRSFGIPGKTSSRYVQRKYCEIDTSLELPGQPHDCAEIQTNGANVSGVYGISPGRSVLPFNVYCDMDTHGGGWTIIQRRKDGSITFSRNWLDYKYGFGSVSSEHWLGNEKIHRLTTLNSYELLINLRSITGGRAYVHYGRFIVENETSYYALSLSNYRGAGGNSLGYVNQHPFSTPDRDYANCTKRCSSGWWFNDHEECAHSNLNGVLGTGSFWEDWHGRRHPIKACEMKIRPKI